MTKSQLGAADFHRSCPGDIVVALQLLLIGHAMTPIPTWFALVGRVSGSRLFVRISAGLSPRGRLLVKTRFSVSVGTGSGLGGIGLVFWKVSGAEGAEMEDLGARQLTQSPSPGS